MKKYLVLFLFFCCSGCTSSQMPTTPVHIGKQTFHCEVAATTKDRAQGLMFRETLAKDAGMLFDLGEEQITHFWMRNTLIPLDIIWIGKDKTVLGIQTAEPCTTQTCEIYSSEKPARWVLEVNAGEFTGKEGDQVEFATEF